MPRFDPAERSALRHSGGVGFRQPMLAILSERYFSDPGWIFERKLDGVRAVVSRDGAGSVLWSRNELGVGVVLSLIHI